MASKLKLSPQIDDLAKSSLLRPNPILDHAVSNSDTKKLPPIAISPLQGQYLAIQCQLIGAKNVLEIGTLGGYSTIWFASTGAHVTSIELNPRHRDVALENTKSYSDKIDIVLGAALDVLPKLHDEGKKFDLIFIDALWEEQWEYFQWALKLARGKGSCIYVDNVVGELIEKEEEEKGYLQSGKSWLTRVGKEEKVQATLVPLLSSHRTREDGMYDGFLLAVVQK